MIIKRLNASFGKLRGSELCLGPGLTIITAPNEAGKSTWCAFLRTMLYGLNTTAKQTKDVLPDKTKYKPWSGAEMEGSMEVRYGGRDITLQRTAQARVPMKAFSAVYTGTGTPVSGLDGVDAGQKLTGVPESVFVRTAFIGQASVKVDPSSELEKRISSLVSSGDEQTSYTEADKRLRAWGRQLSYRGSGTIADKERELAGLEEKLRRLEKRSESSAAIKEELSGLESRRAELERELGAYERLDKQTAQRKLLDATMKIKRAETESEKLKQAVLVNGRAITRGEIFTLRDSIRSVESAESLRAAAAEAEREAQAEAAAAESELSGCVWKTSADTTAAIAEAERLEEAAAASKLRKKRPAWLTVTLLLLLAASAILAVLSAGILFYSLPALCGFAVLAVICLILLVAKPKKQDTGAEEAFHRYLGRFGAASLGELRSLAEECSRLRENKEYSKALHTASGMSLRGAEFSLEKARAASLEKIHTVLPNVRSLQEAAREADRLDEALTRLERSEMEYKTSLGIYEMMSDTHSSELKNLDFETVTLPARSREELQSALERVTAAISEKTVKYGIARGEQRAEGDPLVIGGQISELRAAIEGEKFQLKAVEMALEELRQADEEMQTRFSPLLSRSAGEIMGRLTGGRYEKLTFDSGFDASAKTREETVSRSVLSLSTGTYDQLYLSLRLAMCDILLTGEEPCPIVLDDALANFDDERMVLALDYLREVARRRQVLLFTCHNREAAHFAGEPEVRILSI